MRCPFHISVDMLIIKRKPPKTHRRGPGDVDALEQKTSVAVCPVDRCPWVREVFDDRVVTLAKHILEAVNAI
jgi:hypothetical protein